MGETDMRIEVALITFAVFSSLADARDARAQQATFVFPTNGSNSVDISQPFQWTSVPGVKAYYLYIGSAPGLKDYVDSGEIHATSYLVQSLPGNHLTYARIYTKIGNKQLYTDISFTTRPLARFTYPANGATKVSPTKAFEWTPVDGVQVYYLYVGTTPGAKDLWNSSEIQQTSYQGPTLPAGRVLHARLHTKFDNAWYAINISFTTDSVAAFVFPTNGAVSVDLSEPFRWTEVAGAQSYCVRVGSAPGLKDYVDTGEINATSYLVQSLPADRPLHARVYTKVEGKLPYTDINFTVPSKATFVFPTNAAANVDLAHPFQWTSAPGAEAYYLWVGTGLGLKDLVDTGEIHTTNYTVLKLPLERTLYGRIWTRKTGAGWLRHDITFRVARVVASFIHPRDGQVHVDPSLAIRWTPVADGRARFKLSIGTTPGGKDLVDTNEMAQTSYQATALPADRTLYARVWTRVGTTWRYEDAAYTLAATVAPARIIIPTDGAANIDTGLPFQWTSVDLARGYRLRIGTSVGASDVHDSGTIRVTRRFVSNMPIGTPLFGHVETLIDGTSYGTDFTFTAGKPRDAMNQKIKSALWATNLVREMADQENYPYTWTELADVSLRLESYCTDYASTLVSVLTQMNIPFARRVNVTFNDNMIDTHVVVELLDTVQNRWIILDPSFSVAMKRASNGAWATAEEVQQATRTKQWEDITYEFLGHFGDTLVRRYSLDYPMLYLNVYHQEVPLGQGETVLPYLQQVAAPVSGPRSFYVAQCLDGTAITLKVDGRSTTIPCLGVDSTSYVFSANSITPARSSGRFKLYRPIRNVF
jgi:hypothetical protein